MMRRLCSLLLGLLGLAALLTLGSDHPLSAGKDKPAPEIPPRKGKSETIKLFNGKDLKGWVGHKHLWSVKEDYIDGLNTQPIKVSTYLLTERKFSDFRLLATVKLVKWQSDMHSGIAFWGRNAPEHKDEYTYALGGFGPKAA
jgi:hypothetical protein